MFASECTAYFHADHFSYDFYTRDLDSGASELRVPIHRLSGGEELDHRINGQSLTHRLRALGKKTPGVAPHGPSGETARGDEPGVRGAEQIRQPGTERPRRRCPRP